jgi:hypothetical protein
MKQRIIRHARYCPLTKQNVELLEGQQSSGAGGTAEEWIVARRNCSHAFDCGGKGHDCRWAEGTDRTPHDPMQVP